MKKYYKITPEWAERLNVTATAPRHPDGMFLVLPSVGLQVSERLASSSGGVRLSPEDAFDAIGAVGLDTAQAIASQRGELRHAPLESDDAEATAPDADGAEAGSVDLNEDSHGE